MRVNKFELILTAVAALALAGCASNPSSANSASKGWTVDALTQALATPSRPQADRDRDANRKPAQLMAYYGVMPGMTALDIFAAGGYLTEVLSITVGPTGKVYMQNPQMFAGRFPQRLADNRLPNVVAADGDLPNPNVVPLNSVDFAITAMNFHDVYNRDPAAAKTFLKGVYESLKPGGVLALIDHAGNEGADNAKMHRVSRKAAIDTASAAGFVFEGESDLLAHPADDHTKPVRELEVRGTSDQFALKLRKPKK